jgi:hypothetical protein
MPGIKLDINKEGEVDVNKESMELECFGGCLCSDLELKDDPPVYWCSYSNQLVTYFYYGKGKCPAGKWEKLDLPCGAQNLTPEERRKWYAEALDDPDPEFDSEDPVQGSD